MRFVLPISWSLLLLKDVAQPHLSAFDSPAHTCVHGRGLMLCLQAAAESSAPLSSKVQVMRHHRSLRTLLPLGRIKIFFKENFLEDELPNRFWTRARTFPLRVLWPCSFSMSVFCNAALKGGMAGANPQPAVSGGCSASGEPSSSLKPLTLKLEMFQKSLGMGPTGWLY